MDTRNLTLLLKNEVNGTTMDTGTLQRRIESLQKKKESFCDNLLSEISKYEEAVTNHNNLAVSLSLQQPAETDPDPRSKDQLRDEIERLRDANERQAGDLVTLRHELSAQSSLQRLSSKRLSQISEDEEFEAKHVGAEMQQDIEYLFHVDPSGYDAARQYIADLKQQSVAANNAYGQDVGSPMPVVGHDGTFRGPVRDSRNLPHPPRRRKTLSSRDIEEQSVVPSEITEQPESPKNVIHVTMEVGCLEWGCEAKHQSLRLELLENGVSRIPSDLYFQFVKEAESMQDNDMNSRYNLSVEEIVVIRLYAGNSLFAQNVRYIDSLCDPH